MGKVNLKLLVEGGKASAGPPLGPTLAPLKVNIQQIVSAINEKTKEFAGIQVPVEVSVDTDTKGFELTVGTPSVSQLIKKELKVEKMAKTAWKEPPIGSVPFETVVRIAKAKEGSLKSKTLKAAVKQVVGSCVSFGAQVEGKGPKELMKEIEEGKLDSKLQA